jgi:DNA-binding NtrC family response regulator
MTSGSASAVPGHLGNAASGAQDPASATDVGSRDPEDRRERAGRVSTPGKRILIVDDDGGVREFLIDYFNHSGRDYTVESTSNGIDALEAVHERRPDLVLLDISLPDVNGLDVLKLIHQLDGRIPVIMITGARDARAAGEAMEHGAFAYIPKPLSVAYIDSLVAAALRIR